MFRILRAARAHLAALASTLDPDTISVADAAAAIKELSAIEKQATGMRLLLARRIDNESLFGGAGERSAAHWLAKETGQSPHEAQRDLECSKRLQGLEDTAEAVRAGALSSSQAHHVADGASADPTAEQELLDSAKRESVPELARKAKARKAAALGDDEARRRAAHRRRGFDHGTNAEGEHWGRLNGSASDGARLQAWLKPYLEREFARGRRSGRHESLRARLYDALLAALAAANGIEDWVPDDPDVSEERPSDAAEAASGAAPSSPTPGQGGADPSCDDRATLDLDLDTDTASQSSTSDPTASRGWPEPSSSDGRATLGLEADAAAEGVGGDPSAGSPSISAPPARASAGRPAPPATSPPAMPTPAPIKGSGRSNVQIIVRVDAPALRRGHTEPGEMCEIQGYGPISVADLRPLLPDAAIDIVITNNEDVFNVTHLGRAANARQQTVLDLLKIGCTRRTCTQVGHLQVDHRVDWARVKVTELENLDWLCPHCHALKTREGWELEPGRGKRDMFPPGEHWWKQGRRRPAPVVAA